MTQINFTLDSEQIQDIISNSGANDLAKQMLTTIFNQLLEKERDEYINTDSYSRVDDCVSSRNGYYERSYTTRIGRLELIVPRTYDGEFSLSVFERYTRNEKILLATMLEMYVQGVSTRKVSKVVEELCGVSVSKSFVSTLTSELDSMSISFLKRPLERNYPFISSDALYIKVRETRRIISKAFHVILGNNNLGERELHSFSVSDTISDAHNGEVAAIRDIFCGVAWQRCQVHFMRNVLDKLPRRIQKRLGTNLEFYSRQIISRLHETLKTVFVNDTQKNIGK